MVVKKNEHMFIKPFESNFFLKVIDRLRIIWTIKHLIGKCILSPVIIHYLAVYLSIYVHDIKVIN